MAVNTKYFRSYKSPGIGRSSLYNYISYIKSKLPLILLCLCLIIPCFQNSYSSENDTVRIQLKWFHQFQFAGYYAAVEKGFYTDEGLDVTFLERDPKQEYIDVVVKGDAEYGVADAGLFIYAKQGQPVVLLAQIFQHSPLVYLSLRDSGIQSPYDMAGKRIMVDNTLPDRGHFLAMIQNTMGGSQEVNFVPHNFRLADLVEGKTDVISAYVTNEPFILKQQNVEFNIINPQSYGIDFYGDNLFTTYSEINQHPKRIDKVIRGTIRGWEYALDHQDEIIDLIINKYKSSKSRESLVYEARMIESLVRKDLIPLGEINPGRYKGFARFHAQLGNIRDENIPEGFIYQTSEIPVISLTPEERAWLKEHPVLTVGVDSDFPPFEFVDSDGRHVGMSADYLDLVSRRLGVEMKVVPDLSWEDVLSRTYDKKLDIIAACTLTPERTDHLLFTKPYMKQPTAIVTRKSDAVIGDLESLAGRKVALVRDYAFTELTLRYQPDVNPVYVDSVFEGLNIVMNGEADALVCSLPTISYKIRKNNLPGLRVTAFAGFETDGLSMAIRNDWPVLARILDKTLDSISYKEHFKIKQQWIYGVLPDTGQKLPLTDEERLWLAENPIITLAIDDGYPPKNYRNEKGELVGLSIDYVELIGKKLGAHIRFEGSNWSNAFNKALRHEVDGIINADMLEERKKYLNFTNVYAEYPQALVVYQDAPHIDGFADLSGKKIAVKKATSQMAILKRANPEIDIVEVQTTLEALNTLINKNVFGVYDDASVLYYYISERLLTNLKVALVHYEPPVGYARIGLRNDSPYLVSLFNKAIAAISDEERREIKNRWIDIEIPLISKNERSFLNTLIESEFNWLKEHPVIRVGADPGWAPLEFRGKDGNFHGVAMDYFRRFEEILGVKFEIVKTNSWQETNNLLKIGDIDMVSSVLKTPERSKYLDFTEPYYSVPIKIFTRRDVVYVSSLNELKGKNVIVVENYATHEILSDNYPEINLVLAKSIPDALEILDKGGADAFFESIATTSYYINKIGYMDIIAAGDTPYSYDIAMAARKDRAPLSSILNKAISSIPDEEKSIISQKWFTFSYEGGFDYSLLWKILVFVGIIFVLIIIWNRRLTHAVERATNELRQTNEALRESESRYRIFFESASDAIFLFEKERFIDCNPAALDIFGCENRKDILNYHPGEFSPPTQPDGSNSIEKARKCIIAAFNGTPQTFEWKHIKKDGTPFDAEVSLHRIEVQGIPHLQAFVRDISERKRSENALRASEERFRALTENSIDVIMRFDRKGRHLYVNPAVERETGIPPEKFIGKTHRELGFPEHLISIWDEAIQRVFSEEKINQIEFQLPNGSWIDWLLMPEIDENGKVRAVITSARDITERKRLEDQLRQSQKMEAIGQLAGGVAHDFNNILQVISGHTELISEDIQKDSPIKDDLAQVSKAANRAISLVRQLLAFSRREVLQLEYINLNELINNLLKMVGRIIGEHIELIYRPGANPGMIHADPGQIEQIVLNLCVNARDAMPDGGKLIIETGNTLFDEEYCKNYPEAKPGEYVSLKVSDTGPGIPAGIRDRIFEPFFTTKGVGEGTGLGLSTVYAITKRHDGLLILYSEEGMGATFKVYLPLAALNDSAAEIQVKKRLENIQGNGETILVAEDDNQVRGLVVSILGKAGYRVLTASDGEEAIKVYVKHEKEIDLALLDVVMPKKSGHMVYKFIRENNAALPVLFASGYNMDVLDTEHLPEGTFNIIYKPYDKSILLASLREVLGKKS